MSTGVSVYDRLTQTTWPLAHGDDPSITDDGRLVAFYSSDSFLVPGDTNAVRDVFVSDRGGTHVSASASAIAARRETTSRSVDG